MVWVEQGVLDLLACWGCMASKAVRAGSRSGERTFEVVKAYQVS